MNEPTTSPDRRVSPGTVIALLAALALFVTLALVVDARSGWLYGVDHHIDSSLNGYVRDNRWQLWFWKACAATPIAFRVGALIGAVVLWWYRRRAAALFLVVSVGGTMILSTVVKDAVGRARPVLAHPVVATLHSKSFPSGHALVSFVTFGALVLLVRPCVRRGVFAVVATAAALGTLAVGVSRLMLGVHFPTDVLGGWLLGGLWLAVVAALFDPSGARRIADRRPD